MIHQRAMCFLGAVVLITCTNCSAVAPSATPAPTTAATAPAMAIATPAARPTTTLVVDSTQAITLEETLVVTPTKSLTVTAPLAPTATVTPETVTPETVTPETVTPATATPESATPETLTPTTTLTVTQPMSPTENASAPNPLVEQAITDLAQRTSSPVSDIEVVSVEAVVWPDKGMGCPRPGMVYPQVQVDGLLIHLSVGGVVYAYHSGEGRAPFLCEG